MTIKIAEFGEVLGFEDMEGAPGQCDWGDCDEPAVCFRMDSYENRDHHIGWLPVCERHRTEE